MTTFINSQLPNTSVLAERGQKKNDSKLIPVNFQPYSISTQEDIWASKILLKSPLLSQTCLYIYTENSDKPGHLV